jgi:hypothetical protein
MYQELARRLDNGREDKEMVPAKLEAYRALACSASVPVSEPRVLVVHDCVTRFKADYIEIDDAGEGEPRMRDVEDGDVELVDSDGYGLVSPRQMDKWRKELGLEYLPAGCCVRNSFCKGMVFTFDFHRFAGGVEEVKDVWGDVHQVRDVDMIVTTSMLKLWDSYPSYAEYQNRCRENGYGYSVTKTTPEAVERERRLNYQFIQSYEFDDEQIQELILPTIEEVEGVLGGDVRRTILFLGGTEMTEQTAGDGTPPFVRALMADERVMNDPFVRSRVARLAKTRMDGAKIGQVKVHGNYLTVSGDPVSLCQHVFGMPVTGLLKAGQAYSKYWSDAEQIVCFRPPMTCHNNIRVFNTVSSVRLKIGIGIWIP